MPKIKSTSMPKIKSTSIQIATHDGKFHADEIVACAIIGKIHPNNIITRTRNQSIINSSHIVVDVGGIYDADAGRFDHHQDDCDLTFTHDYTNNWSKIPMSSAGMVYKYYGKKLLLIVLKEEGLLGGVDKKTISALTQQIYWQVYKEFFREIDAIDNGVRQWAATDLSTTPEYPITNNLTSLIGGMNYVNTSDDSKQSHLFKEAMILSLNILILKIRKCWIDTVGYNTEKIQIIEDLDKRFETHPSGHIVFCRQNYRNWRRVLGEYEKKTNKSPLVWFCIYPYKEEWRIGTVNDRSFTPRRLIHDKETLMKRGVAKKDIIFIHKNRFISATTNMISAIALAKVCLKDYV